MYNFLSSSAAETGGEEAAGGEQQGEGAQEEEGEVRWEGVYCATWNLCLLDRTGKDGPSDIRKEKTH